MADRSKPSDAGLIRPRKEKLITLPELTADGDEITVKIKQVYISDAWIDMKGMSSLADPPVKGQRKLSKEKSAAVMRKIAEIGIVEPKFSFDQRVEGLAFWDDLSVGNQLFAINGILEFTGISISVAGNSSGEEGAAERLATFLGKHDGGEGDSGGAVDALHGGGGRAARRRRVREAAKGKG